MGKKITSIVLFIAVCGMSSIYSMYSLVPTTFSLSGDIDSIERDMRDIMNRLARFNVNVEGQSFEGFINRCHYLEKIVSINISEFWGDGFYPSVKMNDDIIEKLGKLHNLEELSLKWKKLKKIPAAIAELKNLRKLDLSHNSLNGEDALLGILSLPYLEELHLGWNDLKNLLPTEKVWSKLLKLKVLYIGGNYLSANNVSCLEKGLKHTEIRGLQLTI